MKLVQSNSLKSKKSKKKKSVTDYSSWDALTQSKYLYDLHSQLGRSMSLADCYKVASDAVNNLN